MIQLRKRLKAVELMAFILLCMPSVVSAVTLGSQPTVAHGRELMVIGEFRQALAELRDLLSNTPQDNEALYWAGETALAMEQYPESERYFRTILSAGPSPHYYAAQHRLWLTHLAASQDLKAARQQVRREITSRLESDCTNVDCIYAAYRGYKYLWDANNRAQMMLRLVPLSITASEPNSLAQTIPDELLEEVIQARGDLRQRLAEVFIKNYPRRRGIGLASQVYMQGKIAAGLDLLAYDQLMLINKNNRHLRLPGVTWLLSKKAYDRAEQVLAEYAALFKQQFDEERSWYATEEGWKTFAQWEQARAQYLAGRLAMARSQWAIAEQHLHAAVSVSLHPGQVWSALAQTYHANGQIQGAVAAWRSALEAGGAEPNAESALRALLRADGKEVTEPRIFFAQHQAIAQFSDQTSAVGLAGVRSLHVAWGDYDGDGDADLLLDGPRIFRNEGGKFVEVTTSLGLSSDLRSTGGNWVDADNDGWLDLWLSGEKTNHLFRNIAGTAFVDVTAEAFSGVTFNGRTEASAWGDLNNDGWLDLYTANYERRGLERGMCYRDQLFENDGHRFQDVTEALGVRTDAPLCGRGAMWTDMNDDGAQDILVANYRGGRNLLWLNQKKFFKEAAQEFAMRGTLRRGVYGNSIGIAVGDVNNDLQQDIYLTNLSHPRYIDITDTSKLLISTPAGFVEKNQGWGLEYSESPADPVFADFDNDGDLDLYVSSIYPGALSHMYENRDGKFRDVTWLSGARLDNSWGVAVADFDRDGDLDLLVARPDGVRLLRNDSAQQPWLEIAVRSPRCNQFGVGAKIEVDAGGVKQRRELHSVRGTGSQDELVAHFGFGSRAPDTIIVQVRDLCGGSVQASAAAGQRLVLETIPAREY